MKLFSIFGLVMTSGFHFSTVECSPITVELPIRPSQILNITSASSGIRERPNLRLGTGYPIHLSIPHSTLSLDLKVETSKGALNPLEVEALLHIVLRDIHTSLDEPVKKTTWFQDPSNPNGPHFAIAPQILRRQLTWRKVTIVVEALLDYYHNQAFWLQIAFLIHDDEKGAMGSGGLIFREAQNDLNGGANGSTATS